MHTIKKYLLLAFALLPVVLSAKHIVGGEITYKFKSRTGNTTTLSFTMKIYRDCASAGGAQLDENASVSLFTKKTNRRVHSLMVPLQAVRVVDKNILPCLITPDNLCVQEGLYTWEDDLPDMVDSTESYVVVYQRCCRNFDIVNIYNSNNVGATYTLDITQYALTSKNNSPDFKSFPPLLLCTGQPINFDHSATDAEKDQLIYSFCEPISGGGPGMSNNNCQVPLPIPACYPPLDQIVFKSPTFSFDKPLAGDPVVVIDPNTGLISGLAPPQGRYIVAVCVQEYRNGRLLSILHRDFQFNVEECSRTVEAKIKADTVIGRNYIIQACGAKNVPISNLSSGRANVTDVQYQITIPGKILKYTDWEPVIDFPDTGVYHGFLYLNPGTPCGDTIQLTFNVFPKAQTGFSYSYDTCVAGPVSFKDRSHSDGGPIVSRLWVFDAAHQSKLQNPQFQYTTPGQKNITLFTTDVKGCKSDTTATINYEPIPALIVVQPSTARGCTPQKVFFNNLSFPIDSTYDVKWTFGDTGTSKAISPTYTYNTPGIYSVHIDITSPIGCKTNKNFPNLVTVLQGTKADFIYSPQHVTSLNKTVVFTDKSTNASRWTWNFAAKGVSFFENPTYAFRDTGLQKVQLVGSNQFCSDTIVQYIDVEPIVSYFLPNAFTPNDDAKNDLYKGAGHLDGMMNYKMQIWNRWGERVYITTNPEDGWNGKKNNSGEPSPADVYMCIVTYTTPRGQEKELRSYATLIR